MKRFAENFGVALCGLITSILVAIANVSVAKMLGFDFFTFAIWGILPAGAALTGFAAASGYYFGSLYFHKRANLSLLVQMAVVAVLTQWLIYYLGYITLVLDDGRRASDLVPFTTYLSLSLTSAHYRIGRGSTDLGAVGSFGYWLATLQFFGFLLGGVALYFALRARAVCGSCELYLRPLSKKEKTFHNAESASNYYDHLFQHPVDSNEFAELIRGKALVAKPAQGAVKVATVLHGCPKCKTQMIEEKIKVFNGREWKDADKVSRRVAIPSGIDLVPVFRG